VPPQGSIIRGPITRAADYQRRRNRVFVAYPYSHYPRAAYRPIFERAGQEHGFSPVFADDTLTNTHLLEKIGQLLQGVELAMFDLTTWNATVALELGVAYGLHLNDSLPKYWILYSVAEGHERDVPSDVRGIDSLRYTDLADLETTLRPKLAKRFPNHSARRRV